MRALPFNDLRHTKGEKRRKPPRIHEISANMRLVLRWAALAFLRRSHSPVQERYALEMVGRS